MTADPNIRRTLAGILSLSADAAASVDPDDVEVLATLLDGTAGIDDIDDAVLERVERALGPRRLADLLLEHRLARRKPLWQRPALRMAVAASVLLTFGAILTLTQPWSAGRQSLFDPAGRPQWGPSPPMLGSGTVKSIDIPPIAGPDSRSRLATVGIACGADRYASGVVVSLDGLVLTSYRAIDVIAQNAAVQGETPRVEITVAADHPNGPSPVRSMLATLERADPARDLALLRIDAPDGAAFSSIELADSFNDGDVCFAIASGPGTRGWMVRKGRVIGLTPWPPEGGDLVVDRLLGELVQTDCDLAAGAIGGPLVDVDGRLIGLTTWARRTSDAGVAALHIPSSMIREFLDDAVGAAATPFDAWTAGRPDGVLLEPTFIDIDDDGGTDALVHWHANATRTKPLAIVVYVDFAERSSDDIVSVARPLAAVPRGLWGMEQLGEFRFDVFRLERIDGVVSIGYTNDAGIVDEIRIGMADSDRADVIWSRDASDVWSATVDTADQRMLDETRLPGDRISLLTKVWDSPRRR